MSQSESPKPRRRRSNKTLTSTLDAMSVLEVGDGSASDADGASSVTLRPGLTASGRQSRARGATPRELADMLARLLGGGSVLLAMWLEVEEAAMTPEEAAAISEPLSRIINRSNIGKKLAKQLLGADDYLALSIALFSYGMRLMPLIAAKASQPKDAKPLQSQPAPAPVRPVEQPKPGSNGSKPDGYDGSGVKFSGIGGFGWDAE